MLPYQLVFCLTSLLFNVITAALLFVLTSSISVVTNPTQFGLLLVSAILETLQSICLGFLIWQSHAWREPKKISDRSQLYLPLFLLGVLPWLGAAIMSAVGIGALAADKDSKFFQRQSTTVSLVIWIVAFFFQALLLLMLAFTRRLEGAGSKSVFLKNKPALPMQQGSTSEMPMTIDSTTFHDKLPSPPNLSPLDRSIRSSFSTTGRSSSSKRNFSLRSSSQPRHSEPSSSDGPSSRPSQDGGFDTWDTSGLSTQMKETVLQSKPLAKCVALPTIPGSRSPSPAKALEGPFFDPSPEHSPPRSPLPQPPVSQHGSPNPGSPDTPRFTTRSPPVAMTPLNTAVSSPPQRYSDLGSQATSPISPETPTFTSRFPPAGSRPPDTAPSSPLPRQSKRFSRPPSLLRKQSGEENIHPLFRCSSPTPPPSASPTTVVTAAPEAGEVIDRRTLHRMRSTSQRSSSQPPAKSPLRRSESFANARSNKAPLSPSLPGSEALPSTSGQPKSMHQRKRSASFEGCIIRSEM